MSVRHFVDRLLGSEGSLWRSVFGALRWKLSIPFRDRRDREKLDFLGRVRPFSMVGYRRLSNVYDLCREVEKQGLPGAFVECGVWKGGVGAVMARVASRDRITWLFDSFEGLPKPTDADGADAGRWTGKCAVRLEDVETLLFTTLGLDRSSIRIRKGWFNDTLPSACDEIGPIAILRLDGDWYESTRVSLETLYDNVTTGGAVILDDYGYWAGFRRAVDEFLAERKIEAAIQRIDASGSWFRKP